MSEKKNQTLFDENENENLTRLDLDFSKPSSDSSQPTSDSDELFGDTNDDESNSDDGSDSGSGGEDDNYQDEDEGEEETVDEIKKEKMQFQKEIIKKNTGNEKKQNQETKKEESGTDNDQKSNLNRILNNLDSEKGFNNNGLPMNGIGESISLKNFTMNDFLFKDPLTIKLNMIEKEEKKRLRKGIQPLKKKKQKNEKETHKQQQEQEQEQEKEKEKEKELSEENNYLEQLKNEIDELNLKENETSKLLEQEIQLDSILDLQNDIVKTQKKSLVYLTLMNEHFENLFLEKLLLNQLFLQSQPRYLPNGSPNSACVLFKALLKWDTFFQIEYFNNPIFNLDYQFNNSIQIEKTQTQDLNNLKSPNKFHFRQDLVNIFENFFLDTIDHFKEDMKKSIWLFLNIVTLISLVETFKYDKYCKEKNSSSQETKLNGGTNKNNKNLFNKSPNKEIINNFIQILKKLFNKSFKIICNEHCLKLILPYFSKGFLPFSKSNTNGINDKEKEKEKEKQKQKQKEKEKEKKNQKQKQKDEQKQGKKDQGKQKNIKESAKSARMIVKKTLHNFKSELIQKQIPREIQNLMITEILRVLDLELVNHMLLNGEYCTSGNGFQIKDLLSQLVGWLKKKHIIKTINDKFLKIKQVANCLVMKNSIIEMLKNNSDEYKNICPDLNILQIERILTNFQNDEWDSIPLSQKSFNNLAISVEQIIENKINKQSPSLSSSKTTTTTETSSPQSSSPFSHFEENQTIQSPSDFDFSSIKTSGWNKAKPSEILKKKSKFGFLFKDKFLF
ncbi:RIBOSOMAL RNA-PROCESSING [Anaeramoeba flamelloides]|uniref:RIBOSOMAL RNA-PROCESSING n=1 Tax=Anaeramoeba flamelloides TaxID=1746091 RepID=A0AAV7ZWS1_9EUKA|nr:RIBOSOMAL RNA-PROCESSING [Anaeramoeba flamelloides]